MCQACEEFRAQLERKCLEAGAEFTEEQLDRCTSVIHEIEAVEQRLLQELNAQQQEARAQMARLEAEYRKRRAVLELALADQKFLERLDHWN